VTITAHIKAIHFQVAAAILAAAGHQAATILEAAMTQEDHLILEEVIDMSWINIDKSLFDELLKLSTPCGTLENLETGDFIKQYAFLPDSMPGIMHQMKCGTESYHIGVVKYGGYQQPAYTGIGTYGQQTITYQDIKEALREVLEENQE
jgi:hypothetical protein